MLTIMSLKRSLKKIPILYWIGVRLHKLRDQLHSVEGANNLIRIKGDTYRLRKSIIGNNNLVEIGLSTLIEASIRIRGNGNRLVIEDGCILGPECSFWLEGNNNRIIIGKNTTMASSCHFNAQEHGTSIIVGEDCMFSNSITVRTSDSHPIFNSEGERINPAESVTIGRHVWVAPNSVIMKGAEIGDGCIIGSRSLVNKKIPDSCLAVGMPARIVKEAIRWTREDVLN